MFKISLTFRFDKLSNLSKSVHTGENSQILTVSNKKVYLYKNGNHFDTINSMTGLYGQSYYCEKCDKPYQNKDGHKCKTKDKISVAVVKK
jgi:hypothetical protein